MKEIQIIKKYEGFNSEGTIVKQCKALDYIMLIPLVSNMLWICYLIVRTKYYFQTDEEENTKTSSSNPSEDFKQ